MATQHLQHNHMSMASEPQPTQQLWPLAISSAVPPLVNDHSLQRAAQHPVHPQELTSHQSTYYTWPLL